MEVCKSDSNTNSTAAAKNTNHNVKSLICHFKQHAYILFLNIHVLILTNSDGFIKKQQKKQTSKTLNKAAIQKEPNDSFKRPTCQSEKPGNVCSG